MCALVIYEYRFSVEIFDSLPSDVCKRTHSQHFSQHDGRRRQNHFRQGKITENTYIETTQTKYVGSKKNLMSERYRMESPKNPIQEIINKKYFMNSRTEKRKSYFSLKLRIIFKTCNHRIFSKPEIAEKEGERLTERKRFY